MNPVIVTVQVSVRNNSVQLKVSVSDRTSGRARIAAAGTAFLGQSVGPLCADAGTVDSEFSLALH